MATTLNCSFLTWHGSPKMQLMKPVGVTVKQQYTMSAPLGWRVCTVWIVVLMGSHFPIVCKQRLQAVKCIGAATAVSFTKACLPPVSVCSNFHPPETEGARLRRAILVRCCPGLPSPVFRQMWNAICRRHELSIYCKQLEVLS